MSFLFLRKKILTVLNGKQTKKANFVFTVYPLHVPFNGNTCKFHFVKIQKILLPFCETVV